MLLGLIRPREGSVLVDDVALDDSRLAAWRSQIGYVAQDTFLFNDTIRFNLGWAAPGATDAEMFEALEHASAAEYVSRLPAGIDTVIGERGVRLSGGERQRLSLARALLRKPRLLVLDEATSALDSENEERIYRAILDLHGEMTIVIITHRLSTVRNADLIHVLDAGRLVASGTWSELIGVEGRFRELCRAQGIVVEQTSVSL
jgi:ATP-binding cassette, subfamily C, bacterial